MTADGGEDAGIDAGMDAGLPEVSGTMQVTWVTDTPTTLPYDLTQTALTAVVPVDGGTSWVTYPAISQSDGTFTIPNVPAGGYYLRLSTWTAQFTTARELDMSYASIGRSTAAYPQQTNTELVLNATGMQPWQTEDDLMLVSLNAGFINRYLPYYTYQNPAVTAGATSLYLPLAYTYLRSPLIDSSMGDTAQLFQLTTSSTFGGHPVLTLVRSTALSPFTVVDGQSVSTNGSFAPVPQDQTLIFNWDRAAFSATGPAAVPGTTSTEYQSVGLYALPLAHTWGFYDSSALLFEMTPAVGTSQLSDTVTYGNPLPASWEKIVLFGSYFARTYSLSGATPANASGGTYIYARESDVANGVISPLVTPVTTVLVNGSPSTTPLTGSATPTLQWTAPPSADVAGYYVSAYRLGVQNGRTTRTYSALIRTSQTSATFLPGMLTPGTYHFVVSVVGGNPEFKFDSQPYRTPAPFGYAFTLTETYTVQ